MKTTMKQLAAGTFIAFLLFVGNVNAKGTEAKASGHESIETSLQIEKWMTEEFLWNSNSVSNSELASETEATLELENWMTSPDIWSQATGIVNETETTMELENWMTSEATWNVIHNDSDMELTVENWMTESNIL